MKEFKNYISVAGWETGYYDPRTCNNGGGYWNFHGFVTVEYGDGVAVMEVDDTSCGDFGDRWCVEIFMPDGTGWHDGTSFDWAEYAATDEEAEAFAERYGYDLRGLCLSARSDVECVAWAEREVLEV